VLAKAPGHLIKMLFPQTRNTIYCSSSLLIQQWGNGDPH
jgi:hypothetical protein